VIYSKYYDPAYGIAKYLADAQSPKGNFPARCYYGESFSILLWSHFDKEFEDNIQKALEYYKQKNKKLNQLHWEFNNYALFKYYIKTKDPVVGELVKDLKFRGTKVINWTLLRALTRLLRNKPIDKLKANLEINKCLLRQKDGFFFDDKNVRSFQYHCFSTALIGELFDLTKKLKLKNSFLNGTNFILDFILPNGDTLYIGRGQEQIFGYGTLLFILEYAYKLTGEKIYKNKARQVLMYLNRFRRPDGSFPLVLRKGEEGYPKEINTKDTQYLGWYAYNNYFDYLPFLGYYLIKTHLIQSSCFQGVNTYKEKAVTNSIKYLKDYTVYTSNKYNAIVSKPGGYWTNDMPFPYVCYKNESIFPCYGGEQFVDSIYSIEQIPLPFGKTPLKWAYFREMDYKLIKDKLIAKCKYYKFSRKYEFHTSGFDIYDDIIFKKDIFFEEFYPVNLYFFKLTKITATEFETDYNGVKAKISTSKPCIIENSKFYCARGKLKSLRERILNVSFSKGDILNRKISVILS
jgi:hypothetical protein